MDKLLFVPDIMARYQVSAPTARKIMRRCVHMEQPKLAVAERALAQYEFEMNREPGQTKEAPTQNPKRTTGWKEPPRDANGNYYFPRRRA